MNKNESLFQLVKSLSKSEKRYIRLQSKSNQNSKRYMLLFDEILKHANSNYGYDEGAVKLNLRYQTTGSSFSVVKNYLSEYILKNLARYHLNNTKVFKIYEMIENAVILYNKAMYSAFYKKLTAARSAALKHERFALALHIMSFELSVILDNQDLVRNQTLFEQLENILAKYKNVILFERLIFDLLELMQKSGTARNEGIVRKLKLISNIELLRAEKNAISVSAKERFYYANQLLSYFQGMHKLTILYISKRYKLINGNPSVFGKRNRFFRPDIVSDMLQIYIFKNDLKNMAKYFKVLKNMNTSSLSERTHIKACYNHLRLLAIPLMKNVKDVNNTIQEAYSFLTQNKGIIKPNKEIFLHIILAIMCLRNRRFEMALALINKLSTSRFVKHNTAIGQDARLFSALIHFELGNFEYLEHLSTSIKRKSILQNKRNRFEEIYIKMLLKNSGNIKEEVMKENLNLALAGLLKLKDDKYESNSLLYFEIIYWIQRKIKRAGAEEMTINSN